MRSQILMAAALAALASIPAVALSDRPVRVDPPKPPRRRLPAQTAEARSEIAAHNEAVERRKAEKKARKAERRAAGVKGLDQC